MDKMKQELELTKLSNVVRVILDWLLREKIQRCLAINYNNARQMKLKCALGFCNSRTLRTILKVKVQLMFLNICLWELRWGTVNLIPGACKSYYRIFSFLQLYGSLNSWNGVIFLLC